MASELALEYGEKKEMVELVLCVCAPVLSEIVVAVARFCLGSNHGSYYPVVLYLYRRALYSHGSNRN